MSTQPESKVDWILSTIFQLSYGELREISERMSPYIIERLCNRNVTREDYREVMDVLYECAEDWMISNKGYDEKGGRVLSMRSRD